METLKVETGHELQGIALGPECRGRVEGVWFQRSGSRTLMNGRICRSLIWLYNARCSALCDDSLVAERWRSKPIRPLR